MTRKDKHKTSMSNPFKKWYRWKYSGFITVPVVIAIVIIGLFYQQGQLEFFESWSCDLLIEYRDKELTTMAHPSYNELTSEQKQYYDKIIETDCMFKP